MYEKPPAEQPGAFSVSDHHMLGIIPYGAVLVEIDILRSSHAGDHHLSGIT